MHIEVQVALNFVISYLYNKLPRRRVNIFGEELEKALKEKFEGHWYPDKPFKGSAFRCLKTGDPVDPVLQRAAREAGVPVHDVLDNLPRELAVWVDPGEVSYRIGEKGAVKLLLSESGAGAGGAGGEGSPAGGGASGGGSGGGAGAAASAEDREVTRTFNPEAQCFRPVEADGHAHAGSASPQPAPSPAGSPSPVAASFLTRPPPPPLTFTTATFAQTKFGSTKLKTSSKRANRMSPTEFSNYIKQRAMQQQQQQQQLQSPRPLSPADFYLAGYPPAHGSHFPYHELYHGPPPHHHHHQVFGGAGAGAGAAASSTDGPPPPPPAKQLLPPPPPPHHYQAHSPYQHLLVAN